MIISGFEAVLHTKILPKIRQNFFALKLYGTVVIVLQPEIAFFSQNRGGSSAHLGPQRFATQKRGANRVGQQPEPVTGLSPYPTRLLAWLKSLANGESVTRSLQILTWNYKKRQRKQRGSYHVLSNYYSQTFLKEFDKHVGLLICIDKQKVQRLSVKNSPNQ